MDSKERRTMLETLKKIRDGLNKEVSVRRSMPSNVVPFPGTQNMNPNIQHANPNSGIGLNGMPNNAVPFSGNGEQNDNVRRMKAPIPGIPVMTDSDINELPRAGFASGLVLAGITFVTELLFLAISYFMFK